MAPRSAHSPTRDGTWTMNPRYHRLRWIISRWISIILCGAVGGLVALAVGPLVARLVAPLKTRLADLDVLTSTLVIIAGLGTVCWYYGRRRGRGFIGIRFPRFTPEALKANFAVVEFLRDLAARRRITPAQIALVRLGRLQCPKLGLPKTGSARYSGVGCFQARRNGYG